MEKRKLTIPEMQERLKEMGRKVAKKNIKRRAGLQPIAIPKDLPVPYYALMD